MKSEPSPDDDIVWQVNPANLLRTVGMTLLLSGCTCETELEPPAYIGDNAFSTEEREAIQAGATWLHAQVGERPPRIEWRDAGATIVRERRDAVGRCIGGVVYLDPVGKPGEGMDLARLPGLTAHELAHCRFDFSEGYRGDAQSDGVMRVLVPMRWTDSERAQCAASPKCPAAGR